MGTLTRLMFSLSADGLCCALWMIWWSSSRMNWTPWASSRIHLSFILLTTDTTLDSLACCMTSAHCTNMTFVCHCSSQAQEQGKMSNLMFQSCIMILGPQSWV